MTILARRSIWGRCPLRDMTDGGGLAQRVVPYFIVAVDGGRARARAAAGAFLVMVGLCGER